MEITSFTYIEIENDDNIWAVPLNECKDLKHPVKPIFPLFILVENQIGKDFVVIANIISYIIPNKIIDGVNGGIADDYKQLGFWRIKYKSA